MMEDQILTEFRRLRNEYKKINPNESMVQISERRLPKICPNEETKKIIGFVDKLLGKVVDEEDLSMEDFHSLICCGANCVVNICRSFNILVYDDLPEVFPKDKEQQTKLFTTSTKKFYHLLLKANSVPETPPDEEMHQFWSKIWGQGAKIKNNSPCIDHEVKRIKAKTIVAMEAQIEIRDLRRALKKMKNWSPPGIDGIQTFWYKKFPSTHQTLVDKINEVVAKPDKMPQFFTQGLTRLVPKTPTADNASEYRPMTVLPSVYKIISRCIGDKLVQYYTNNGILAEEQMGDRRGCHGCKKILSIDSVAMAQEQVFGVYIDYKKALDMISHDWLLQTLRVYRVDETIVGFLESAMKVWRTRLGLRGEMGNIELRRGLFQGDPLSVVLYWTAINPLSFLLRNNVNGLRLKNGSTLTHLLYMDDLKLYSSSFHGLKAMFEVFSEFTDHIAMEISQEKSYVFALHRGRRVAVQPLSTKTGAKLRVLDDDPVYLGYKQLPTIHHPLNIQEKMASFNGKIVKVLETKLPFAAKVAAISHLTNVTISKSFSVLKWERVGIVEFVDCLSRTLNGTKSKMILRRYSKVLVRIHLKIFSEVLRMRNYFRSGRSELVQIVVRNDDQITALNLLNKNK